MDAADLPTLPGSYVLILHLPRDCSIRVGRLGKWNFRAGHYLYLGSARGPGGLKARLGRHLRAPVCLHWHIDYLRSRATPVGAWYVVDKRPLECAWRAEMTRAGLSMPVPGFGASDCGCPAHLFYCPEAPPSHLPRLLERAAGGSTAPRGWVRALL